MKRTRRARKVGDYLALSIYILTFLMHFSVWDLYLVADSLENQNDLFLGNVRKYRLALFSRTNRTNVFLKQNAQECQHFVHRTRTWVRTELHCSGQPTDEITIPGYQKCGWLLECGFQKKIQCRYGISRHFIMKSWLCQRQKIVGDKVIRRYAETQRSIGH